jgi:hypothetical protein
MSVSYSTLLPDLPESPGFCRDCRNDIGFPYGRCYFCSLNREILDGTNAIAVTTPPSSRHVSYPQRFTRKEGPNHMKDSDIVLLLRAAPIDGLTPTIDAVRHRARRQRQRLLVTWAGPSLVVAVALLSR